MREKQLCPLKNGKLIRYCDKKQCAWWDSLAKSCAVLVIAKLGLDGGSFKELEKEAKRRGH